MKKLIVLLLAIFYVVIFGTKNWAQVIDSFSDGNFTSNPAWSGKTSSWQIVTSSTLSSGATNSNTLHLNCANEGYCTDYIGLQRTEEGISTIMGILVRMI